MQYFCNPWQADFQQLLYVHAVGTVITFRVCVILCSIYMGEVSVDMKLVWSIINAKIGAHIIQVITIGHTMVIWGGHYKKVFRKRLHSACHAISAWHVQQQTAHVFLFTPPPPTLSACEILLMLT